MYTELINCKGFDTLSTLLWDQLFLDYINAINLCAINDYTFSFSLLSFHICTLCSYNSCQVLQLVDYWQGKGQSSSLECADTHKLFNFHPQRSVVRKYWAGQRWGKHKMKRQAGKALHISLWALCLCHRCSFVLVYKVKEFDFLKTFKCCQRRAAWWYSG